MEPLSKIVVMAMNEITFSYYIERWYKDDNRIVTAISFDGKEIKTEWMELADYLKACGE